MNSRKIENLKSEKVKVELNYKAHIMKIKNQRIKSKKLI